MTNKFLAGAAALAMLAGPAVAAVAVKGDSYKPAAAYKLAGETKPGMTPVDASLIHALAIRDKIAADWQAGDDGFAWAEASTKVAVAERASAAPTITFISEPVVQPIALARNGAYPVCRGDADDSCINGWEAGRRGPGVNQPLAYYPGDKRQRS